MTPVEQFSWEDAGHEGNIRCRSSAVGTTFALEGILILPDVRDEIAVGPANCGGSDTTHTYFSNNPNARVRSWTSTGGVCEVVNTDGGAATVFFPLFESSLLLDGWAVDAGGSELGEAFDYKLRVSIGFQVTRGTITVVEGLLATSIGSFDLGRCLVTARRSKEVTTFPQGLKPGGKRPVNDLPSGAIALGAVPCDGGDEGRPAASRGGLHVPPVRGRGHPGRDPGPPHGVVPDRRQGRVGHGRHRRQRLRHRNGGV